MSKRSCLYCYTTLGQDEHDFHPTCSKKFFGQTLIPEAPFSDGDLKHLALQTVKSKKVVPGVQPKLLLDLAKKQGEKQPERFTIVGLWGSYILKPPTPQFAQLPEAEDATMQMAKAMGINTVPHSLIRLKNQQLAYITKRVDRQKGKKLAMEDMCQLTERLTEHKYLGSYEQIAKALLKYASNPGIEVVNFYELVLFCFLTGNNDMHLKNFSLLHDGKGNYRLSPAYDLVPSSLFMPEDTEELALTLNGKKNKIKWSDFTTAMEKAHITAKTGEYLLQKARKTLDKGLHVMDRSFLSEDFKNRFRDLIDIRLKQLKA